MIIPIGTNRPIRKPTKVVYWLIGINIVVHIAMMALDARSPDLAQQVEETLWLSVPADVSRAPGYTAEEFTEELLRVPPGQRVPDYAFKPWGLVTYQFLHGGMLHLLGNMLFLWVFGPNIEDRFGRVFFLAFYVLGGVFAGAVHMFFSVERFETTVGPVSWVGAVVGASGSVSALTGAYLVLFPKTAVKVFVFFLFIGVFFVPAWVFIAFSIFWDFAMQGAAEVRGGSSVAHLAHIGGYAFGAGVSLAMLWRGVIPREPYDLFTMGRQAHRRRKFRELTAAQGRQAWSSQLDPDSAVRAKHHRGKDRPAPIDEALATARTEVVGLVRAGGMDAACDRYRDLLSAHGEQVVGRDAQLAIANHLNAAGRAGEAATAYRLFLERFKRDHESERVKLLLALLYARQLNDPVGASKLIVTVRPESLGEGERGVLDALRAEVGP